MYFSFLYLIKNNINKIIRKNIPSPLVIVANEIGINDKIIIFLLENKNNVIPSVMNNKYNGSVIPKNEFIINLGSKAMIVAPIIANFSETNFLHKKYVGIIIKIEIITEIIF